MIPLFAIFHMRSRGWRFPLKLWLPLFLIWLLLLPLVLLLAPFALLACLIVQVNPWRAFTAGWGLLAALRGLQIEVRDPDADIYIAIR